MYRAEHTRGEELRDSTLDGEIDKYAWTSLEPGILYKIAERLARRDTGSMRLTCKAWQQSISTGVPSMAITKKIFRGQLEGLPKKFPGLVRLDLSNYAWLTDTEIKGLQDLPCLREFEVIFGHELSDEGICSLSTMTGIQRLKLVNFIRLNDANIGVLSNLPALKDLTIQGAPRITDSGIDCLRKLSSLQQLSINYARDITDDGLGFLAKLPHLQELSLLGCTSVNGSGLSNLQDLAGFTKLVLARTEVTEKGLDSLRLLTSLRRLSLAHCQQITDATLSVLDGLPLEWLDLTKCSHVTGRGIKLLNKLDGWANLASNTPANYMQFLFDDIPRNEDMEHANEQAIIA